MKPQRLPNLMDAIQIALAQVESPTAVRDRLINELFGQTSTKGIQAWAHLANVLFFAIARHHGEPAARQIFKEAGPPPKRLLIALRNATLLDRLDGMKPRPNIAKLAKELAEENKELPKDRRRGAGGTNPSNLEDHIRDLVQARKQRPTTRGF